MNFLNSAILMGLAAVALPILIHLFTRARSRPIPFSSLRFLKQLQNQKIRRLKIRQLLLLLLRTLAVLLLVLAFARPTCRSTSGSGVRSRTSAVILLDNSASMAIEEQGEALFAAAKRAGGRIIEQMQPGDELYLCTTTDTMQVADRRAFHDFQALRSRLDATPLDFRATDISAGMLFAQNLLLSARNVNKELYLLSDMQETGFALDSLPPRDSQLRQYAVPLLASHPSNLAVTGVKLRSAILERGKMVEVEVTLTNSGQEPARTKLVQLFIHGQRVAQRTVSLESGAAVQELFRFIIDRDGWIEGQVQLEDDALLEDNQRCFAFYVPERLNIGVIGEATTGSDLLQLALRSSADSSAYLRLFTAAAARSSGLAIDSLHLLILHDVGRLPDAVVERIAAWHSRGGGIIMVLGRSTDLGWYNARLAPALGLSPALQAIGEGGHFSLGRVDGTHPVFAGIFEGADIQFARPQFNFALRVASSPEQHTLLSYSSGDPYLYEVRRENGALLVFTSSFEPEVSDVAYRTIFAPLLHRSLSYLAAHGQNRGVELSAGELLRHRLAGQELQKQLEIHGPDGRVDLVHPRITASGAWIDYSATGTPGIYSLRADGKSLSTWAVNIPARELDLRTAARDRIERSHGLKWVEDPARIGQYIHEERIGREFWRELLVAGLLLLLLEMVLYREKGEVAPEEDSKEMQTRS
ncbi:MAG TPA: BatA domain-containing protein [bacterium]|nr:BatA domain-containing protein [bacterium]